MSSLCVSTWDCLSSVLRTQEERMKNEEENNKSSSRVSLRVETTTPLPPPRTSTVLIPSYTQIAVVYVSTGITD